MKTIIQTYNDLAPSYDQRYKTRKHFVEEDIIASFLPELSEGASVLDIGCGTGNMITVGQLLGGKNKYDGDKYCGVDVSPAMLEIAKKKYPDYRFEQLNGSEMIGWGIWDLVLTIFGQLNYMGLPQWVDSMEANLSADESFNMDSPESWGQFLSVMYSDNYKPSYLNGEASFYSIHEVEDVIRKSSLHAEFWGLSFPMLGEENQSYSQMLDIQSTMTLSGDLDGCNYWIIKGGWAEDPRWENLL